MSLVLHIPRTQYEKVSLIDNDLMLVCERKEIGELYMQYIPQAGRLMDAVALLRDHNVIYDLVNDDPAGIVPDS